jgi:uncharacterized protein (DUF1330 family)
MSKWYARLALLAVIAGLDLASIRVVAAAEAEAPPRPVYLVVESEGLTRETNARYAEMLTATLMPFKGRMLVQDAAPVSTGPAAEPNSIISIMSFETSNDLQSWMKSTFTQALLQQREKKFKTRMFTLEGRPVTEPLVSAAKPDGQIRSELPK